MCVKTLMCACSFCECASVSACVDVHDTHTSLPPSPHHSLTAQIRELLYCITVDQQCQLVKDSVVTLGAEQGPISRYVGVKPTAGSLSRVCFERVEVGKGGGKLLLCTNCRSVDASEQVLMWLE